MHNKLYGLFCAEISAPPVELGDVGAQAVTEEAQSASNSSQEEAGLHNTATYTAQLGAAAGAFHIRTETRRTYSFMAARGAKSGSSASATTT